MRDPSFRKTACPKREAYTRVKSTYGLAPTLNELAYM
jgi:hypothetical protein